MKPIEPVKASNWSEQVTRQFNVPQWIGKMGGDYKKLVPLEQQIAIVENDITLIFPFNNVM